MKIIPLITLALLFSAVAGHGASPAANMIARLDLNHDGKISLDEFYRTGPEALHPRMKQVFESFDKTHAGALSYEETAKAIGVVSGVMPKFAPDVKRELGAVELQVHPKTKRAFVEVKVNGVSGVFLLDTGTSDTTVDPNFAKRAGVDFVEICMPIIAGNMGRHGECVALVRVPDLVLGAAHFRDFHAVLQASKQAKYEFGKAIDGVLGANIIFANPVTLDFRQSRMSFAALPVEQNQLQTWQTIPLLKPLHEGDRTANVETEIDGEKVPMLLDSGARIPGVVLVNKPYQESIRKLARDPQARTYLAKTIRISGQVIATDARCLLLEFERPVIGVDFFDQHVIRVDIAAGKVLLKRNA